MTSKVLLFSLVFFSTAGTALAGGPVPGPIAGVGLPAVALIGGAYLAFRAWRRK